MKNSKVVYPNLRGSATYMNLKPDELAAHEMGFSYLIPVDAVMCSIKTHSKYWVIGRK